MENDRSKTTLIHKKENLIFEVSREKSTGKLFIKNTDIEVTGKVMRKNSSENKGYDYSKPADAQDLGDEWDDYAWSADDF